MLDDPLDSEVDAEERISRFVFNEKQFNVNKGRVRPGPFKPPDPEPERPERQLSVYRTEGCDESEVWYLADEYVTKKRTDKRPALARGDLKGNEIMKEDLQILPHPDPHHRHANIVNWPDEDALREFKAVSLAQKARLVVRGTS